METAQFSDIAYAKYLKDITANVEMSHKLFRKRRNDVKFHMKFPSLRFLNQTEYGSKRKTRLSALMINCKIVNKYWKGKCSSHVKREMTQFRLRD